MPEPPYPLHPSVLDRIDPQYAAYYNEHIIDKQQVHFQPVEASRASGVLLPGSGPLLPVGRTEDLTLESHERAESTGPAVRLRAFTPEGEPPSAEGWPIMVWYHGGGWVLGNIDTENKVCANLCNRARCVVVTVDYRLAPEHIFPAAVEDAWETVLWVLGPGKAKLNLDTSKLATGGSSAGGNLAAIVCQRAAARGGKPKFLLQLLSVPVCDNTADTSNNESWAENAEAPALPAEKLLWYRYHYLPDRKDWAHPEASPLLWEGDWSALPPAVIVLGGLDVLRTEGEQFAAKLRAAGVKADVHTMKGTPHPFIAMDGVLDAGKLAITLFCDALKATMYPEAS